jgi:hypothetical protein
MATQSSGTFASEFGDNFVILPAVSMLQFPEDFELSDPVSCGKQAGRAMFMSFRDHPENDMAS